MQPSQHINLSTTRTEYTMDIPRSERSGLITVSREEPNVDDNHNNGCCFFFKCQWRRRVIVSPPKRQSVRGSAVMTRKAEYIGTTNAEVINTMSVEHHADSVERHADVDNSKALTVKGASPNGDVEASDHKSKPLDSHSPQRKRKQNAIETFYDAVNMLQKSIRPNTVHWKAVLEFPARIDVDHVGNVVEMAQILGFSIIEYQEERKAQEKSQKLKDTMNTVVKKVSAVGQAVLTTATNVAKVPFLCLIWLIRKEFLPTTPCDLVSSTVGYLLNVFLFSYWRIAHQRSDCQGCERASQRDRQGIRSYLIGSIEDHGH